MNLLTTTCRSGTAWKNKMNKINALRGMGLAGFGSLLVVAAVPTWAQEGGYFYGGASVGQSRAKIDEARITSTLLGAGLTTTSMTRDEHTRPTSSSAVTSSIATLRSKGATSTSASSAFRPPPYLPAP